MSHPPVISDMLIRRPAMEIYEHFIHPNLLTKFWLSHASGRLEAGKKILWKFKIADAEDTVTVKNLIPGKHISLTWDQGVEVEWTFESKKENETMVSIEVSGIPGNKEKQFTYALDVAQGFMIVLLELKSLLEKGSTMGAVYDKFPDLPHV